MILFGKVIAHHTPHTFVRNIFRGSAEKASIYISLASLIETPGTEVEEIFLGNPADRC